MDEGPDLASGTSSLAALGRTVHMVQRNGTGIGKSWRWHQTPTGSHKELYTIVQLGVRGMKNCELSHPAVLSDYVLRLSRSYQVPELN